ncbi:TauD/TfdA family dioxygenase [Streptomyces sp. NRRL F-5755]|uniref:TauD/TfdA family dioxygenase n=1 Tax=Streptomyces sp. NRRL F-5755 TaxID=1519475 RepID=UPI0006AEBE9D|nr:TauD/TfdA family dioxygenase [Streptomyces sp. NRRL F-5755]
MNHAIQHDVQATPRPFTIPDCSTPQDLRFAFLNLAAHPRGDLMLQELLAAGFVPAIVIEETSTLATRGRRAQLDVLQGVPGFQPPTTSQEMCAEHGIAYVTVDSHNDAITRRTLLAHDLHLAVLGDTRILKPEVIGTLPYGIVNTHPGMLPDVRGNTPYIWAVIHDLPQGATAHLINTGIDRGPVIVSRPLPPVPDATVPRLVHAVNELCAQVVVECLNRIVAGDATLWEQPDDRTVTFREARPEIWELAGDMLREKRPGHREAAPFKVIPADAVIGARVEGLDMRQPPGPAAVEALEDALERYGVLIVPGQSLTPAEEVRFCRALGELDIPPRFEDRRTGHPEIFVIGNPADRAVLFAPDYSGHEDEADISDLEWHADHSQYAVPTWISMMYGVEVPPVGGDTLFACTYSAYEALDPATRRRYDKVRLLHSVKGVNDYLRELGKPEGISEAELELEKEPPQQWPLVRSHPRTGRKALYFGARMSIGAVGMDEEEGRRLVREVTEAATKPEFVYRHRWQQGDVVLWDNRRVVHAASTFNTRRYRRVIHRITVRENAGPA